jgi:tellurite resistance protein
MDDNLVTRRRNNMRVSGETGGKLSELIKHAIDDHEISNTEYERILALADSDGVIDRQERGLLAQLQDMLSDGSIKRIPG